MKKVYDWDIDISVNLPESKKSFVFRLSIHSRIKEINTKLAQKLNLDPFVTNFNFFHKYGYTALSPASTIQQNRIRQNDIIVAKYTLIPGRPRLTKDEISLKRHRAGSAHGLRDAYKSLNSSEPDNKMLTLGEYKDYEKYLLHSKNPGIYGITLEGVCVNEKCISHGKTMTYPLGTGTFSYSRIMNNTKCTVCPYRDRDINPPIVVKAIKFINCLWRVEGRYREQGTGYTKEKVFPLFTKSEGEDSTKFYEIMDKYKWFEMLIFVKNL